MVYSFVLDKVKKPLRLILEIKIESFIPDLSLQLEQGGYIL